MKKQTKEFDYKTIRSFDDACKKEGVDPEKLPDVSMIPEEFRKPITAVYKLIMVFKAINNGWKADGSKRDQYKYYPWFSVLSSGFRFVGSDFYYGRSTTHVGSHLYTDSSEKALYIAEQFKPLYEDFFLYSNNL